MGAGGQDDTDVETDARERVKGAVCKFAKPAGHGQTSVTVTHEDLYASCVGFDTCTATAGGLRFRYIPTRCTRPTS